MDCSAGEIQKTSPTRYVVKVSLIKLCLTAAPGCEAMLLTLPGALGPSYSP